jgi:flagellar basal body-associated protein FliL
MPEEKAKEETRSAVAPAHVPLFSPTGYVIAIIVLIVEGVLVYGITSYLHSPRLPAKPRVVKTEGMSGESLGLGEIKVDFLKTLAGGGEESVRLIIEPFLYFRRDLEEPGKLKRIAERLKPKIRDLIRRMLMEKGLEKLRVPGVLEELKEDIKAQINHVVFGEEVIEEVVYNNLEWL